VNYELAYRIGFHPWEDAANQPSFNEKLAELLEHEERGRAQPYGLALDIGTGSGIWATRLAQRGWQVTGVDLAETALHRAGDRVQEAGVDVRLVHGDVTALRHAGVGSGFQLVLDTGTFHGLNGAQREAMGREVRAIATDGVTVLMLAWAPRRRGPLPRGVSRSEIEAAFPGWSVTDLGATRFEAPRPIEILLKPDERWYRISRD